MGLDISHDCWHGAYSAFMRWRKMIARAAGLPPLELMEGFFNPNEVLENPFFMPLTYGDETTKSRLKDLAGYLPISWECLKPNPLYILLHHSDCEGEIGWEDCIWIAKELENLMQNIPDEDGGGHIGNYKEKTQKFIDGLKLASSQKENIKFY